MRRNASDAPMSAPRNLRDSTARWGMRVALNLAVLLVIAASASAQVSGCQMTGNWTGTLNTGTGWLRLVLHIKSDAAGKLTVTLDSPDQGVAGLAGGDADLSDGTLTFAVPSVHGSYKGTVSADCNSISGSWTQGQPLPLVFEREEAGVKPSPVDGYWMGTLKTPGGSLRIGVQVKTISPGKLALSLDSLDQGARGVPCTDASFVGNAFIFTVPAVHGSYSGTLAADGKTITGTWTQGQPLPLDLTRQEKAPALPAAPKMLPAQPPVALADLKPVLDREFAPLLATGVLAKSTGGGVAIGVIDHGEQRIFAYGVARPDSIFEIGSVTKSFTGLLLAQLVEQKKVTLDEPVRDFLPPGTVAKPQGAEIRLVDLATQHSGLPRLPSNLHAEKDPTNPYAAYHAEQLYAFLAQHGVALPVEPKFLYSNLGYGLLGFVLARRAGVSYGELVKSEITGPLGMKDTETTLSPEQEKGFIAGHTATNGTAPPWDLAALAGAGALRSTVGDLLTFIKAQLHPDQLMPSGVDQSHEATLPAAIAMTHELRADGPPQMKVGMGWLYTEPTHTYWHDGGTGGYTSFVLFQPESDRGVVVLYNREDIGTSAVMFVDRVAANVVALMSGKPALSLGQ